jgi:hypothetical protein
MYLWGCHLGSGFLGCAGTFYSSSERAMLAVMVILAIGGASYLIARAFPNNR